MASARICTRNSSQWCYCDTWRELKHSGTQNVLTSSGWFAGWWQKIGFQEEMFVVDLKNLKVYKGKYHLLHQTVERPGQWIITSNKMYYFLCVLRCINMSTLQILLHFSHCFLFRHQRGSVFLRQMFYFEFRTVRRNLYALWWSLEYVHGSMYSVFPTIVMEIFIQNGVEHVLYGSYIHCICVCAIVLNVMDVLAQWWVLCFYRFSDAVPWLIMVHTVPCWST